MSAIGIRNEHYWINRLAGIEQKFCFDKFCEGAKGYRVVIDPLNAMATKRLLGLGLQKDINIFKLLMAAVVIVLKRYFADPWMVIGTADVDPGIRTPDRKPAFLIFNFPEDERLTIRMLLGRIHEELTAIQKYGDYSRDEFIRKFEANHSGDSKALTELRVIYQPLQPGVGDFAGKLDLQLKLENEGLLLWLRYDAGHIPDFIASGLVAHVKNILESLDNLDRDIEDMEVLSLAEMENIVFGLNRTSRPYPADKTLPQLFKEQVEKIPEGVALVAGGIPLTYRQLDELSDKICWWLMERGTIRQSPVGVLSDNAAFAIIAILGVLKAGCIFIPIDTRHGRRKVIEIIEDSHGLILSEPRFAKEFHGIVEIVFLAMAELPAAPPPFPIEKGSGDDLAYAVYTSGTTGRPKGALNYHRSLINHISWFNRSFQIGPEDKALLVPSFAFGGSLTVIWSALLSGATLHLLPGAVYDPAYIVTYIQDHGITYTKMPPSAIKSLVYSREFSEHGFGKPFRIIQVGGERPESKVFKEFLRVQPDSLICIHYGATEACVGCCAMLIDSANAGMLDTFCLAGYPYDNVAIYICNAGLRPMPVGFIGEICIGGAGVGAGYINRKEMTGEKFVDNPFLPGQRLYRTGDYGRMHADGRLEFIGRRDGQVKINGYRIELTEIDQKLLEHPDIRDCVTLCIKGQNGEDELHTYVVFQSGGTVSRLLDDIADILPGYMRPARVIPVSRIPVTLNGKIDREELVKQATGQAAGNDQRFANAKEETVASIWKGLLGHDGFDRFSNFFHVGGNSLRAVQLVHRLTKQFDRELLVQDIFLYPTIAQLTARLDGVPDGKQLLQISRVEESDYYPLSHAQKRLWLTEQGRLGKTAVYHISQAFLFPYEADLRLIEKAFVSLVERHEILRTVFVMVKGEPKQKVLKEPIVDIRSTDLRFAPDVISEALTSIDKAVPELFDLEKGPLIRLHIYQIGGGYVILHLVMHHIIFDGWSTQVLMRDFLEFHMALREKRDAHLPVLALQYKDFAVWHNKVIASGELAKAESFWLDVLRDLPPRLQFPRDHHRPAAKSGHGALFTRTIPVDLITDVMNRGSHLQKNRFVTVLALTTALLYKYTGQLDIILGIPSAGRLVPELEDQVGCYINVLPVRIRFCVADSFERLLGICEQAVLEAFGHEAVPFDLIVDRLSAGNTENPVPLFDVSVSYNKFDIAIDQPAPLLSDAARRLEYSQQTSKFDLTFHFYDRPEGFTVSFEYDTDLFLEARMERLYRHYETLMEAVRSSPGTPLYAISIADPLEKDVLDICRSVFPQHDKERLIHDRLLPDDADSESVREFAVLLSRRTGVTVTAGDIRLFPTCYLLTTHINSLI